MLLAFVDESNKGDFYGFAAVIADEHATKHLTASLNQLVWQASVDWGIPRTAEIHAHPMFHGQHEWKDVPIRARVGLFFKVVEAIMDEDVCVLLRSVDAARLKERQSRNNYPVDFPPEQICFQHILQRVNMAAQRRDTHALLIADDRNDRERHRERFAIYQTEGTPGVYMHTTLGRLLDTVHFAPSHQSRMLQAADMLAFIYRRRHTVTEQDRRAAEAMNRLWATITASGKVEGLGSWP